MVPLYLIFYILTGMDLLHYYGDLPDSIATHFNADGEATSWMTRDQFAKFHCGFVVFMSLIFPACGWLLTLVPHKYVNVPNKEYWMAPERAKQTITGMRWDFAWMGIAVGSGIIYVDNMVMDAALRNEHGINSADVMPVVYGMAGVAGFFLLRMMLKFRLPRDKGDPKPDDRPK